jgi:hypothetical protein
MEREMLQLAPMNTSPKDDHDRWMTAIMEAVRSLRTASLRRCEQAQQGQDTSRAAGPQTPEPHGECAQTVSRHGCC